MYKFIKIFEDDIYPDFINKYLETKTLNRIKYVSQFCGCDYTNLYNTKFYYSRYDHSLVVAHMTWHFTHDKEATIAALLHDIGTPCFAHSIDYVFGDYINQESSEKDIIDIIKKDEVLLKYLNEDNISLEKLSFKSPFSNETSINLVFLGIVGINPWGRYISLLLFTVKHEIKYFIFSTII